MSGQRQSTSQQDADVSIHDWAQVPDEDLEVHMSDSEGTEQAKEVKKGRQEAIWKERWAEACQQRAEEAWLEREHQEHEEKEKWDHEECVEHKKTPADPSVQFNDWGLDWDDGGDPHGHDQATMCQMPTARKRKKCSWATTEDNEGATGGSRKWARTGSLQGSRKKKGWTGNEDDDDDKIEEVPAPVVPQFEVAHLCLIREALESGGLGQGVPERLYNKWMLMVQGRQVAAMELQALTMQAYVRHMMATLLWPPVGWVGVVAGRVETGTGGSRSV
ncbi:hypothetical protein F5141DRAFT_1213896 [Pisolithus sp. B1]|nr:hypothetical protein F5141DRAFT_1213896 [Pisolithus sp. B1]